MSKEVCLRWSEIVKYNLKEQYIWTRENNGRISIPIGVEDLYSTGELVHYNLSYGDNALVVGEPCTGTGLLVDTMILSLAREYHPNDLKFWLLDCGNLEFYKYERTQSLNLSVLPHIQTCACSFDTKYIISYLKGLYEEVKRRLVLLKDVKTYSNYIHLRETNSTDLEDIPMILFACFDLNKIYNRADKYDKNEIEAYMRFLFREGCKVGLYQLHISRHMREDIPDFMLDNCKIRMCEFIKKEYREKILGKQDNYGDEKHIRRVFVTDIRNDELNCCLQTYIDRDEFWQEINTLYMKYRNEIGEVERHYEYNELDDALYSDQWEAYRDLGNTENSKGLIILGPRRLYSKSRIPENVLFNSENRLHMAAVFDGDVDLINFFNIVMQGISFNSSMDDLKVIVNSQDKKLSTHCDFKHQGISKEILAFADSDTSPRQIIETCKSIMKLRSLEEKELDPVFIILLGWEKGLGFGVRRNDETVDELRKLMEKCGKYNMHFIFISRNIETFPEEIINLAECKVSDWVSEETSRKLFKSGLGAERIGSEHDGNIHIKNCGKVSACQLYVYDQYTTLPKYSIE